MHPARRLWQLYEPYHALTYFAPESRDAYEAIGLRGFWRGYFAGRAAPLGPVGPGVVTAVFYGFDPHFVGRALPSIWTIVSPRDALRARLAGVDTATRRLLDRELTSPTVGEAAELAQRAIDGCDTSGRALFAGNAEVEWPAEPHLQLWHAATLLREYRGDGHVIALAASGLDPCEAHVSQIAASGAPIESIQPYRGWIEDDWAGAADRLRRRGWLDGDGLTGQGRAGRAEVEDMTDRLAQDPVDRLGAERYERLVELLSPLVDTLARNGAIPYPNPIGVTAPGE